MIGKTISHYKILEKLGEGGMGVVYKAEDTKLDRLVALKFLPHSLNVHEADRARFLQEAKAAAAINHPNVCVIHDIQEHEGQEFIVMEYVEGETLSEKTKRQKANLKELLDWAIEIASGLEAAHEKGIVHRDVKSENIMVNAKNQIKVMDFGLAKLKGALKLTKTGSTVGTIAYMSPEQLQGLEADARSDIFSFGVVLYEMLAGHLPFRGEYEAAMMYAIMNEEPEPVQKYLPEASAELLHILNRALEKAPDERYQSVSEMLIDLRRLKRASEKIARPLLGEMKFAESRAEKKKLWWSLAGVGVLAIVVSVLFLQPKRPPELNPNAAFRVLPIPFTQISYPGLSADGNWLAFPAADANGKWEVYFMNASGGAPRRITADSGDEWIESADVSPDGSQVAYDRSDLRLRKSELRLVSSLGGTSKMVVQGGTVPRWRPDGQRIGYISGHPGAFTLSKSGRLEFWSVQPDGADNRLEFMDSTIAVYVTRISVSWSPDGKSVAWIRTFPTGHPEAIVRELETGKERQLTFDKKNIDEVCWTPNDAIIYSSNKGGNVNLWMTPANGGQTVQITKGSGPDIGMKISADGKKLLYLQRQWIGHVWLAHLDGSAAQQITFDERHTWRPSFSPDGQRLLFCMGGSDLFARTAHLYMTNRDGGNRQQMTTGDQATDSPAWSPDGRWIAYGSRSISEPPDSNRVYLLAAANPGTSRLLGTGSPWLWIDTKNFIAVTSSNTWLFSVEGATPKRLSQDSTFAFPIFGEKHVLLRDLHKGREGWYISPTADWRAPTTGQPKKILAGGYTARLAPSRKFLFYVKPEIGEVWKISLPEGKHVRLPGTFSFLQNDFSVGYDGQEIVYVAQRLQGKLVMIENLFK
ncbi:MAG: protein kinase domain-containing protein [bacterium]